MKASLSDSMGELQINRQFAANQKEELTDLYLNKNRPLFDMVVQIVHLIFNISIPIF